MLDLASANITEKAARGRLLKLQFEDFDLFLFFTLLFLFGISEFLMSWLRVSLSGDVLTL